MKSSSSSLLSHTSSTHGSDTIIQISNQKNKYGFRERGDLANLHDDNPEHFSSSRTQKRNPSPPRGRMSFKPNKSVTTGAKGGSNNYWRRSRFSWLCLMLAIIGLVWLYHWYSDRQQKLRFIQYLERADDLNVMLQQMEKHISSAQQKLMEVKELQNPNQHGQAL